MPPIQHACGLGAIMLTIPLMNRYSWPGQVVRNGSNLHIEVRSLVFVLTTSMQRAKHPNPLCVVHTRWATTCSLLASSVKTRDSTYELSFIITITRFRIKPWVQLSPFTLSELGTRNRGMGSRLMVNP